jgi:hypothetical protein
MPELLNDAEVYEAPKTLQWVIEKEASDGADRHPDDGIFPLPLAENSLDRPDKSA